MAPPDPSVEPFRFRSQVAGKTFVEPRFSEGRLITARGGLPYAAAWRATPSGMVPVPKVFSRHAEAAVQLIRNERGTLGPYDEFILTIPVLNWKWRPWNDQPFLGLYMRQLVLDGTDPRSVESGMEVGIDGYGYPKVKGELGFDFDRRRFQVRMGDDPPLLVSLDEERGRAAAETMKRFQATYNTVTTGLGEPSWGIVKTDARATRFRRWASGDAMTLPPPDTALGALMAGFVPSKVQEADAFRFELSKNPNSRHIATRTGYGDAVVAAEQTPRDRAVAASSS